MENQQLIQKLSEAIEKSQSTIDDIEKHPEKTLGDSIDFSNCRNNNQWSGHTSIVSNNEAYTKKHLKRDVVAGSTAIGSTAGYYVGQHTGDKVAKVHNALDKRANLNVTDSKKAFKKHIEKAAKKGINPFKLSDIDTKKLNPQKVKELKSTLKGLTKSQAAKEITKHAADYSKRIKAGRLTGGLKGAAIGGAIGAAAGHGIIKLGDKLQKHLSKTKKKNS